MPELPEVEHARRTFETWTAGHTIERAGSSDAIVVAQPADAFAAALTGRTVKEVGRIGKNVVAELSGGHALWFHLGMTGKLQHAAPGAELPRFTRWWLELAPGGVRICLADARRLGRAVAGERSEVRAKAKLGELGPDALEVDDGPKLAAAIGAARGPIKTALMDQSRLAGVGNIHAAEALWMAKVHPEAPASSLDAEQMEALAAGVQKTLARGIARYEGHEDVQYVEEGGPNPFAIYGKEGAPCPRCGTTIGRAVTQGRSSYFCPQCQAAPKAAKKVASKKAAPTKAAKTATKKTATKKTATKKTATKKTATKKTATKKTAKKRR